MSTPNAGHGAIPGWATIGKRAAGLGVTIIAACALFSWSLQASDHFWGTSFCDSWVIWIFRVPLGAGLALFLVGGLTRLAGEAVSGFNISKDS